MAELFINSGIYKNANSYRLGIFKTESNSVTISQVKDAIYSRILSAIVDYVSEIKTVNPAITEEEEIRSVGDFILRYLPETVFTDSRIEDLADGLFNSWYVQKIISNMQFSVVRSNDKINANVENRISNESQNISESERQNYEEIYQSDSLPELLESILSLNS